MKREDSRRGGAQARPGSPEWGRAALSALLVAILLAAALISHMAARRHARPSRTVTVFQEFPIGERLRYVTLGYTNAVGDALWLEAIQYIGGGRYSPEGNRWLYHVLESVTSLDPRFRPAFEFSGITLGIVEGGIGYSNRLLLKGIALYPDYWRLPFLLAYNRFYVQGEVADGARWMARAAALPGAPPYLSLLASRMFVEARTPSAAIGFLERILEETADPATRSALEGRIGQLRVEEGFLVLEEGVARFRERFGRPPAELSELISSGVMRALPESPVVGRYAVNPSTGAVGHTTVLQRMKLFKQPSMTSK